MTPRGWWLLPGLALVLSACGPRPADPPRLQSPLTEPPLSQSPPSQSRCVGDQAHAAQPRSVAVVPQLPATEVYRLWRPLLQQLGERAGLCFDLVVPSSIPQFEQGLSAGRYDYAFMNPFHQVEELSRYQPLVRDRSTLLKGIVVVNRDAPIQSLQDLQGRQLALPSPNAFAASLLIRAHLRAAGIKVQPVYVTTHSNVYRRVALDPQVVGGGVNNTLARERPELRQRLRVLFETKGYVAHPFSANRRLPQAERERVQQAWLRLGDDPAMAGLLNRVQLARPMASDYRRDYAPLEALQLPALAQPGASS